MTAQRRTLETGHPLNPLHGPQDGAWAPPHHDESCAGTRRGAASSDGGDAHRRRRLPTQRHDNRQRIQTPAEPSVQRGVAHFQKHLSDFFPALRFRRGAAEARGRTGRALLSKNFLRGQQSSRGELRGGQSAPGVLLLYSSS